MAITYETYDHPTHPTLVIVQALEDGKRIGQMSMRTDHTPGELMIMTIFVDVRKQGKGVAKGMHAAGLVEAKKRGLKLRGIVARNPAFKGVWAELQAQREAFEKATP